MLAGADLLLSAAEEGAAHGGAAPAALVAIGSYPVGTIERLRVVLGLTHSGAVRLVDRLEEDGLVERRRSGGRAVSLALTDAGERRMRGVLAGRRRALEGALGGLSPSDRERLAVLLEKLLSGLTDGFERSERICRLCEVDACPQEVCPVERAAEKFGGPGDG